MFRSLLQSRQPRHRRRANRRVDRDGVAVVEAAFCLPLVLLLTIGTLEVCSGIYISESLTVCAYEAVRSGIGIRTTRQEVIDRANEMLTNRGLYVPSDDSNYGVQVTPNSDFSTLPALTPITVKITVPVQGNAPYLFGQYLHPSLSASVTMVREFDGENMPEPAP